MYLGKELRENAIVDIFKFASCEQIYKIFSCKMNKLYWNFYVGRQCLLNPKICIILRLFYFTISPLLLSCVNSFHHFQLSSKLYSAVMKIEINDK